MYVTNMDYFGHLKELSTYTTEHLHNDMWQIKDNIPVCILAHKYKIIIILSMSSKCK